MAIGESFKVFLVDGSSDGLVQCTNNNWKGVAYKISRNQLGKDIDYQYFKNSGVYFLFGEPDNEDKPVVYIGQAGVRKNGEAILNRLKEHIRNPDKEYWTEAIAFTNNDNTLELTHISYLEHTFCAIANGAGRYTAKNGNDPNLGNVSEEVKADLQRYIEYAKLVMEILGHKIFVPKPKSEKTDTSADQLFYLGKKSDNEKNATMKRTSEGFLVLADSFINPDISDSLSQGYKNLRTKYESLIENGVLKEDILFSSPSAASSFVLGSSSNGNIAWKKADGKTLNEVEKEEIKVE